MVCCRPARPRPGLRRRDARPCRGPGPRPRPGRLVADIRWPYPAGPEGTGSAELAWARRNGFELGLVDVQRRLPLPVPAERLDALAVEAAAHHEGYELRSFNGPIPDELAEGWVALDATLMAEAPMGDIEREAETADVARLRAEEAMIAQAGPGQGQHRGARPSR